MPADGRNAAIPVQDHVTAIHSAASNRMTRTVSNTSSDFADRVQGRLDRLGLSPDAAAAAAGLSAAALRGVLEGGTPPPRGKRLVQLAEALSTSVAYLVGLDPDDPVPGEYLQEDQGELGLLAMDEEALLRAYRRLDMPTRAALLLIAARLSPEPVADEKPPRQSRLANPP